jgi:hypothetical protein
MKFYPTCERNSGPPAQGSKEAIGYRTLLKPGKGGREIAIKMRIVSSEASYQS